MKDLNVDSLTTDEIYELLALLKSELIVRTGIDKTNYYPWKRLEVGDHFIVYYGKEDLAIVANRMSANACKYGKRHGTKYSCKRSELFLIVTRTK